MKYSFTPLKPSIFLFGVIFWQLHLYCYLHKKQGIPLSACCPFPQQFLVALSWARNRTLTPPLTTKIPLLEACDKMNHQHISLIFYYTWARRKLPDYFKRKTNFQQFQISSTSNLTYLLHCPTWMPSPRFPHLLVSCLPALLWCWRRGSGRVTLVASLVPLQYS